MKKLILVGVLFILNLTVKAQTGQYDWLKSTYNWVISSVPQGQDSLFPGGQYINNLCYGYNRARISWYIIDELFYSNKSITPQHIKNDVEMRSKHSMREVRKTEVFPDKLIPLGVPHTLRLINISFYPEEKGPNNYDVLPSVVSSGIDSTGKLKDPQSRFGGIMWAVENPNFEATNIDTLEFWLMDPFIENPTNHGELYIQLGEISEDILKDGIMQAENGLDKNGIYTNNGKTVWGYVPKSPVSNYEFDSIASSFQDVGYDGLNDEAEQQFFKSYLDTITSTFGDSSRAYLNALIDPSGDNSYFFRSNVLDTNDRDILEMYKYHNVTESSGSYKPDVEDMNKDFVLNTIDAHYQYVIKLESDMSVGMNYLSEKHVAHVLLENSKSADVTWYNFKIPLHEYSEKIGYIRDFGRINYMRLILRGFNDNVVLRLAKAEQFYYPPLTGEESKDRITVYPNPNYGEFFINLEEVKNPESISIYNITGELIYYENIENFKNTEKKIWFKDQRSGLYVIVVRAAGGTLFEKIMRY